MTVSTSVKFCRSVLANKFYLTVREDLLVTMHLHPMSSTFHVSDLIEHLWEKSLLYSAISCVNSNIDLKNYAVDRIKNLVIFTFIIYVVYYYYLKFHSFFN